MATDLKALKERQAKGETLTAEELALLAAETDDSDDNFDKERAMATIKNLRAFEKDAKAKLRKLEELEKAENDRKTADMSKAEKAEAELAKVAPELEKLRKENTELLLREKMAITAAELKVEFASPKAQKTAYGLLDADIVGEDGAGMKEAIAALQKSDGYLFAAGDGKQQAPNIDAQNKGKGSTVIQNADLIAKKRAEYGNL